MSEYMSAKDVSAKLGVSTKTARKIMQSMPHLVIGGQKRKTLRVEQRTFEQAMRDMTAYPTAKERQIAREMQCRRDKLIREGLLTPDGKIPKRRAQHA